MHQTAWEALSSFQPIVKLFNKTNDKSARWVIPFHPGDPAQLILSRQTWESGGIEQITLVIRFKATGQTIYYGAIDEKGVFYPSRQLRAEDTPQKRKVWELLKALRNDPQKILAEAGKRSGYCCICNRELSDPQSIRAGIGPVCAAKYGWSTEPQLDLNFRKEPQ